ncbi:MAG: phosphatase PAP2 family protein [Chthoniobacterales bacterium]|jgi:undecaprenyl-diphosphatase|nr:phosphatase PAP2 family protein [Chthoniobacterales bacterium]
MNQPPRRRLDRSLRFVRNRFSPEGYLGLHLTVGLLIMVLFAWCFSEIAEDLVPNAGAVAADQGVTNWFQAQGQPQLTAIMQVVTFFGSVGFVTGASIACGLLLAARRAWDWLLALAFTMLGGSLLNILLKHLFHRQRPVLENPLVTLTSFGFPSGHTMGSTLFYGFLSLCALHSAKSWPGRTAVVLAAALTVTAVGLSRIYLGAHYLSDVLAAIAAGIVWLAFSWTAIETFRRRRLTRNTAVASPRET